MQITVAQNDNLAIFTWNEACDECDYKAIGFTDQEVEQIIETKAHMGKQVEGYEVEVGF